MHIEPTLRQCGLTVMLAVLCSGCQTRSFDHGDTPLGNSTEGTFESFGAVVGSPGSTGFNPGGNYPEPAVSRCGGVLGDLPPILNLTSAWAVVAVPGATAAGDPIEAGSVLLRISEQAIGSCGDEPQPDRFGSSSSGTDTTGGNGATSFGGSTQTGDRGFELLLTPEEFTVGVHELDTLAAPRVSVYGSGAISSSAVEASIELLHVDNDCVVGIARGFVSDGDEPFMEGGFVAMTCQLQCIPSAGSDC